MRLNIYRYSGSLAMGTCSLGQRGASCSHRQLAVLMVNSSLYCHASDLNRTHVTAQLALVSFAAPVLLLRSALIRGTASGPAKLISHVSDLWLTDTQLKCPFLCQTGLLDGESNAAVAAGVNIMLSAKTTAGICQLQALSVVGRCRTFDSR